MSEFDQFDGIFDELLPDDFSGVTSWRHHFKNFDEFVETGLLTVRVSYASAEGQINPVALLADHRQTWLYGPDDDETLGEYFERLKFEASRLKATWFFVSKKTMVGNTKASENLPDVSDPEAIDKALEEGLLGEGVFYFASQHDGDEKEYRHGIMNAHGNRLGEAIEGNPQQTVNSLKEILD